MPNTFTLPTKCTFTRGKQTFAKNRESLGGFLFITRPSEWPAYEELLITLYHQTKTELDAFLTFLDDNHGLKIDLVRVWAENGCDPEQSVTWRGFILSSTFAQSTDWRPGLPVGCNNNKLYNISFQFQGNPVVIL